jgi:hypothetical protein
MSLSFYEAYPDYQDGQKNSQCLYDHQCRSDLYCLADQKTNQTVCRAPEEKINCQRTVQDQRCHMILNNGHKGICPDHLCPPTVPIDLTIVDKHKCDQSELFQSKHNSVFNMCIFTDPYNGYPEIMPIKCCNPLMNSNYDQANSSIRDNYLNQL